MCGPGRRRHARRVAPSIAAAAWLLSPASAASAGPRRASQGHPQPSPCYFDRLDGRRISASTLSALLRPTVLLGLTEEWPAASKWSAEYFAEVHGDVGGYMRDHNQLELRDIDVTVAGYLARDTGSPGSNLSEAAAFFVNDYEDSKLLDRLDGDYSPPAALRHIGALRVFALEREYAGVAFHRHEAAWQALVSGSKAWFVLPPSVKAVPLSDPCDFLELGPPPLAEQCTLQAGEVLFVPPGWWHATCSLPAAPSIAIGGVGSIAAWPPALLAARGGDVPGAVAGPSEELPPGGGIFIGGERPLFLAAAFGHAAVAEALLAAGAEVDAPRRDGRTAAQEAARRGDLALLRALQAAGADLERADVNGSRVLHHACAERGHAAVVAHLLERKVNAEARRGDGRTPLHVACRSHSNPVPILRALLQAGVPPSPRDGHGMTPLMHCAAAGNAQGVGLLLRFGGGESALAVDNAGSDALGHALAGRGDAGVVQRLLAAGLPAEGRVGLAAQLGEPGVMPLLVGGGAATGGALLIAAKAGHVPTIRGLVEELGVQVGEVDPEGGATPLHAAALSGHLGAVSALLALRADASATDVDGLQAMHYAAATKGTASARRQQELMQALARSSDAAAWAPRSKGGLTPLHLAASAGDAQLSEWLVFGVAGADPKAADGSGTTPADAAEKAGHAALAESLRRWRPRGAEAHGEL